MADAADQIYGELHRIIVGSGCPIAIGFVVVVLLFVCYFMWRMIGPKGKYWERDK